MLTIILEDELEKEGELLIRMSGLSDDDFYRFCQRNPLLPIERTKERDILIMSPVDDFSSSRNFELGADLAFWNRALPTPVIAFDSSGGFTLPSGVARSPDAAWISAANWNAIPAHLRSPIVPFAHITPEFVVEMLHSPETATVAMSPSDRLKKTQDKMEEYIADGAKLG